MSLSDPIYFLFLALVFFLYYLLETGLPRRVLLLAASYIFYFDLSRFYILVLFFVTIVAYRGALLLRVQELEKRRFLLFSLIITLALVPLLVFKYLGVLLALGGNTFLMTMALPIGISFFTFAALGYLIDVYLEVVEPERDIGRVALFLAFFPLVSAGPIERAGRLMPQFDLAATFSAERAISALRLIFIGLIMKLFIAGDLQKSVDALFDAPQNCLPVEKLFGTIFYTLLLYADFAGYSLIAIGSARLLGLEVRPNFQQPLLSTTIPEFWRNWHISLSSWVRDYLFSSLRMEWRSRGNLGMAAALMVSFLILGVWHGARWGFLVFGAMHGMLVVLSTFTLARRDAFWKSIAMPPSLLLGARTLVTLSLVMLVFVVFRARTLSDALMIYQGIFSFDLLRGLAHSSGYFFAHSNRLMILNFRENLGMWFGIIILIAGDVLVRNKITISRFPVWIQVTLYYIGATIILYKWTAGNVPQSFQYYKF